MSGQVTASALSYGVYHVYIMLSSEVVQANCLQEEDTLDKRQGH